MFKTISLPLDGIITDTTHIHYQSFIHAFRFLNIEIPTNLSFEKQKKFRNSAWLDFLTFLTMQQKYVVRQKAKQYYDDELYTISYEDIYPGIDELIHESKDQEIELRCYATNPLAEKLLLKLGLESDIKLVSLDDVNNLSNDILIIDDLADLSLQSTLKIILTQDAHCASVKHCIQNTEEITLAYLKTLWEEQHDL